MTIKSRITFLKKQIKTRKQLLQELVDTREQEEQIIRKSIIEREKELHKLMEKL